jgi:hypothetical protein
MRKFYLVLLSLCAVCINAQNKIIGYKYWFNYDTVPKIVEINPSANSLLSIQIDAPDFNKGVNIIYLQTIDEKNNLSVPISSFFYGAQSAAVTSLHYWFNDRTRLAKTIYLQTGKVVNILQDINASELKDGIHYMTIRVKDDIGNWSVPVSQFFYKTSATQFADNKVVSYSYFFDNNYQDVIQGEITPENHILFINDLAIGQLSQGLHRITFLLKDARGLSSQPLTAFLTITPAGKITQNASTVYRYWFDNLLEKMVTTELVPPFVSGNIDETVDLTNFRGLNRKMYVQVSDSKGLWSVPTIDTVTINSNVGLKNLSGDNDLIFYPNPNKGEFFIKSSLTENALLVISDVVGKIIYTGNLPVQNQHKVTVAKVPFGNYFIWFIKSDGNITEKGKLIIEGQY